MAKKNKRKTESRMAPVNADPVTIPLWEQHPALWSMGLLIVLLCIQFSAVLFGGKTFLPPDSITSQCFQPFVDDALRRGIYPLWNPYIFAGMPSLASLTRAPFLELLGALADGVLWLVRQVAPVSQFLKSFANYFLLGSMMYLFLRGRKLAANIAFFGTIAIVFTPQIIAFTVFGHSTKLGTAALIPIIFLLAERVMEKRKILDFALLGIAMGLQLLRAHVQICYYTQLMVGLYWLYRLVISLREKENKTRLMTSSALLLGAVLAGVLISSVLHLSVWEYSHYSIRGGTGSGLDFNYASNWSFPPSEMTTFLIPSFMGFGGQTYWGPMPFTDFPIYLGLVTFCLAGLALVLKRDRTTWFFSALFVFSLLVAFGRHLPILYGPMFRFLPFFNKFRIPSMINILMIFSQMSLAAIALDQLLKKPGERIQKAVKTYMLVFGGVVLLLFMVLMFGKTAYLGWAARAGRNALAAYDMAVSDGLRALMLFAVTWLLVSFAQKTVRWTLILPFAFTLLVLIDSWSVNKRFMHPTTPVENSGYFRATPDVAYLKNQDGPFRILPVNDTRPANWYMYHFIETVTGYHAAKIKIYQEFIEKFTWANGFPRKYLQSQENGLAVRNPSSVLPHEARAHDAFFKLMNIRYVVSPVNMAQLDTGLVMVQAPAAQGMNGIFEYRHTLPRVWFPREIMTVIGRDPILNYMASGEFDPERTALLEEPLGKEIGDPGANTARVVKHDIHDIVVEADMKSAGLLVFSEIYYPAGWKALVDGKPVRIYKTDYLLRSVWLDKGQHRIEMVFRPRMFRVGLFLSIGTLGLMLFIVVFCWRRSKNQIPVEG